MLLGKFVSLGARPLFGLGNTGSSDIKFHAIERGERARDESGFEINSQVIDGMDGGTTALSASSYEQRSEIHRFRKPEPCSIHLGKKILSSASTIQFAARKQGRKPFLVLNRTLNKSGLETGNNSTIAPLSLSFSIVPYLRMKKRQTIQRTGIFSTSLERTVQFVISCIKGLTLARPRLGWAQRQYCVTGWVKS